MAATDVNDRDTTTTHDMAQRDNIRIVEQEHLTSKVAVIAAITPGHGKHDLAPSIMKRAAPATTEARF